jgi:hypothetical protein
MNYALELVLFDCNQTRLLHELSELPADLGQP